MQGIYQVKNKELKPLVSKAMKLAAGFDDFKVEHIPRTRNHKADRLANLALDSQS
jgi:ribonuclease HI